MEPETSLAPDERGPSVIGVAFRRALGGGDGAYVVQVTFSVNGALQTVAVGAVPGEDPTHTRDRDAAAKLLGLRDARLTPVVYDFLVTLALAWVRSRTLGDVQANGGASDPSAGGWVSARSLSTLQEWQKLRVPRSDPASSLRGFQLHIKSFAPKSSIEVAEEAAFGTLLWLSKGFTSATGAYRLGLASRDLQSVSGLSDPTCRPESLLEAERVLVLDSSQLSAFGVSTPSAHALLPPAEVETNGAPPDSSSDRIARLAPSAESQAPSDCADPGVSGDEAGTVDSRDGASSSENNQSEATALPLAEFRLPPGAAEPGSRLEIGRLPAAEVASSSGGTIREVRGETSPESPQPKGAPALQRPFSRAVQRRALPFALIPLVLGAVFWLVLRDPAPQGTYDLQSPNAYVPAQVRHEWDKKIDVRKSPPLSQQASSIAARGQEPETRIGAKVALSRRPHSIVRLFLRDKWAELTFEASECDESLVEKDPDPCRTAGLMQAQALQEEYWYAEPLVLAMDEILDGPTNITRTELELHLTAQGIVSVFELIDIGRLERFLETAERRRWGKIDELDTPLGRESIEAIRMRDEARRADDVTRRAMRYFYVRGAATRLGWGKFLGPLEAVEPKPTIGDVVWP